MNNNSQMFKETKNEESEESMNNSLAEGKYQNFEKMIAKMINIFQ